MNILDILDIVIEWVAFGLVILGIVLLFASKTIRPYLRQGLQIMWSKKYLWFVGIFAGITAYGGEVNFLMQKVYDVASFRDYIAAIREVVVKGEAHDFLNLLRQGYANSPWILTGYVAIIILLIALIYWLVIISQGLIMRLAGRIVAGESGTFIDAVSTTAGKFWSLLKVAIMFLLIGWAAWLVLVGLPTMIYFLTGASAWTGVAQVGSYISLVISFFNLFLLQYATATVVLYSKQPVDAVVHAWRIFRRNILLTFELALGLFAANLITTFVLAAVLAFVFQVQTMTTFISMLVILILQLGLSSAFSFASTTALFVHLQNNSPESKLGQWTEKIVNLATVKKEV